jgi:hypothetical protein
MLVQMLEWDQAVKQQVVPETRRTVLEIQHEGYSRQANYAKQFEEPAQEAPRRLPLGEAPVLLARAKGKKGEHGAQLLGLHPLQGQGIDITLDTRLLHIFTRLLREQVANTDWDISLALSPDAPPREAGPASGQQKLN